MDHRRKISDSQIRAIFGSPETAKVLGSRFGVSEQMIYLIRSRRVHRDLTKGLVRGRPARQASPKIDAAALADAIIDRLIKRLRLRDTTMPVHARTTTRGRSATASGKEAV